MPLGPPASHVAFIVGSKAYAGLNSSKDLYKYDPARNVLTLKTRFPGAAQNLAQGFGLNGKGYVVGGYRVDRAGEGSILAELWEYTPE
jgi:N-acetylneuraminic acid mutarotase